MRHDRRTALKAVATGFVLTLAATRAGAQDEEIVDYLFVQNAKAVALKDGVLTLSDVAGETLYFSDRPERITGRVTTAKFVAHWTTGDDSFKADPPNAVLSIHHEPEPLDVVVVLKNPQLKGADLTYDVDVLDGDNLAEGTAASLFIDTIGRPLTPLSFAGASRRSGRRTARRVARRN